MKLLIDTHLLILAAADTLPNEAVPYFINEENELYFSPVSMWEIYKKKGIKHPNLKIDLNALYWGLLENGYIELYIKSRHTLLAGDLPDIYKDPFDRILIAQAKAEGATLLTSDKIVSKYSQAIYITSPPSFQNVKKQG